MSTNFRENVLGAEVFALECSHSREKIPKNSEKLVKISPKPKKIILTRGNNICYNESNS